MIFEWYGHRLHYTDESTWPSRIGEMPDLPLRSRRRCCSCTASEADAATGSINDAISPPPAASSPLTCPDMDCPVEPPCRSAPILQP